MRFEVPFPVIFPFLSCILNGKNITYDAIGNPLNDGTYSYTWDQGRQLAAISGNGQNISYKYNDSVIRTEKTVNGVTTKYQYSEIISKT